MDPPLPLPLPLPLQLPQQPPPAPPPAPPHSNTSPPQTQPTMMGPAHTDCIDSPPRSRPMEPNLDDPLPLSKLRFMCSYGGHIVPRPHDKSLCYVGGETHIVVVDRHTSLAPLQSRLSNSLLNGRPFTLKYQLPSEDLDSLISVSTDEDLENMIEEYNRMQCSSKQSRLRLFLFPVKLDSCQSAGPILENAEKSEEWFLDALNGASGMLNRGFSESTSVNCLLGLDDSGDLRSNHVELVVDVENLQKIVKQGHDVHSVPDSPMFESRSSFGSISSAHYMANLPPIRVHVQEGAGGGGSSRGLMQDQKVMGIEEQFAQVAIGATVTHKQDEGFLVLSSPGQIQSQICYSGVPVISPVVGEYQNRVFSDDERSDHGVPVVYRKPLVTQPQQHSQTQALPPQVHSKTGNGGNGGSVADLPSPDSVSSENSLGNVANRQNAPVYHEIPAQIPSMENKVSATPVADQKAPFASDQRTRACAIQQLDSAYVLQPHIDQHQRQPQPAQQFMHPHGHYIHPPGPVPISAYYPVYPPQQDHLSQLDQQYPVYFYPSRPPQVYGLPVKSAITESSTAPTCSHAQAPSNPAVPASVAFNPMRNPPMVNPELAAPAMYRLATNAAPPMLQVPSGQQQQQFVGFPRIPSQFVTGAAGASNYAYEYADPAHAPMFYTQMPSQYQTVVMPDASGPLPSDNTQHIRSSQPL